MENLSPLRLSMGSQFFLSSGLMMGTNRPSAVFESAENMYTDPYAANDSRNSFSNRLVSSQLPSIRQTASSVSLFPPFGVGESSLTTDWGPILSINPIAKAAAIPPFSTSFSTKCLLFAKTSILGMAELASFP